MPDVYLFDGTSIAYRAFYAMRGLSTSKGFPTGAIYGFLRTLLKLYKEFSPEYIAVAFDVGRKTFRTDISKDYKANRKPAPDAFKAQLPYIKKFLKCLGIAVLEMEGYEADDIIGTVASKLSAEGYKVFIVTQDKDMRQLVGDNIKVISISGKNGSRKIYDAESFTKEYGIEPHQLPDFFGLAGDSTDNIPGVPGIGKKTAIKLIRSYRTLEGVYENLHRIAPSCRKALKEFKDRAFMSRELARINTAVPLDVPAELLKPGKADQKCLKELILSLEMKSIAEEIEKLAPGVLKTPGVQEKALSLEAIKEKLSAKDLFHQPEAVLVPNATCTIGVEEGYARLPVSQITQVLPKRGRIYTFNLKSLFHSLGTVIKGYPFIDLSICQYLLNPLMKSYTPEDILRERTGLLTEDASYHPAKLLEAGRGILKELKAEGMHPLYENIEHPLIYVLYTMEKRGVRFDKEYLRNMERTLKEKMKGLEEEIFRIAGASFNLNSPKQVAEVLFVKLKLKPIKRTRSGFSTDEETLTHLALSGNRIAELILEHRKLSKLRGTNIKGIEKRMDESGRVHTTFLQTGTATGRLSSLAPNLQNLPVSNGSFNVRRAVVAGEGFTLVWADYSQIELRILAHLSQDEKLITAYRSGKDIHSETARRLFKTDSVSEPLRRVAKMVNFGIIYGMGAKGLSERLGIPLKEAEDYINRYFEEFPGVKEYIERTIESAYSRGYVKTLFGRRRPLPELFSSEKSVRSFGERVAINAVVQGTSADIVKLAMVKLQEEVERLGGFIILQVHDEIVVEVPEGEEERARRLVKEVMEKVVKLSVPLEAKVSSGRHWS